MKREFTPLVRGQQLKDDLLKIIQLLKNIAFVLPGSTPIPCVDMRTGSPLSLEGGELVKIEQYLQNPDFLSDIAYIEKNDRNENEFKTPELDELYSTDDTVSADEMRTKKSPVSVSS